ncbi:TPA: hypothetical protein K8N17_002033 [Clostridium perfringens]|uniref:hypothetical protein n=1 Tax=Clostridium perfringens TaxID=1502 RepID=UPI001CB270AD|nr:hypothetical protein [Clostridium perfringens]MDH5095252.1 hypothetical protein [Clostridium perfringens]UBK34871.1 hypothetical protein KLF25_00255 [Clostridium perfringens]HBI6990118.1 hypothetical protein [Clostridium perfringens]HBI6992804.1 hypothetical protein [Clostridium perfringens]HBI6998723.1 hypothetical protein [Clostridium perfringens]
MNNKAREERNAYMREWRKKNKDRVKEYNSSYWERKSKLREKRNNQYNTSSI